MLFLFIFLCSTGFANEANIDYLIPLLEKKIQNTIKAEGVPGAAIAIVSKDKILYLNTFGVKKVGKKDKISPDTLFQIGSLSKPINATVAAILQDKGKLSLYDPVNRFIPNFHLRNVQQSPKICHLLSHSTGITPNGFNELIEAYAPRYQIVAKLQKRKPVAPPGKVFAYHNAMYGLVEDIIARATGKRLSLVLKEQLFSPLGMNNACVGYQSLVDAEDKAYPHVANGRGRYVPADKYSQGYYSFGAAGGINASVKDLIPFLQLYLGKPSHIVSRKTLNELTSPFVKNDKAVLKSEAKKGLITNTYYGLGWHSMNYGHQKIIYHQGHLKGFRSFMGYLPNDVGIIILTNADRRHASKIALRFFDLYVNGAH